MKKAACFRGMFLHPPQWWRDFCTVCKSLTRVASVGYTTNESSRLRCCQECTLSFRGPSGIDHREERTSKVDAQCTGCPFSLFRSFEWCRHACAKQWDYHQNPSAVLNEHRLPWMDRPWRLDALIWHKVCIEDHSIVVVPSISIHEGTKRGRSRRNGNFASKRSSTGMKWYETQSRDCLKSNDHERQTSTIACGCCKWFYANIGDK